MFRMNFIYTSCLQNDFSSPGFPIDGCLYLSVLSGAVLGGETWKLRGFFLLYTTYVHQISNAPSRLECVFEYDYGFTAFVLGQTPLHSIYQKRTSIGTCSESTTFKFTTLPVDGTMF